jgi:hypothetical protein
MHTRIRKEKYPPGLLRGQGWWDILLQKQSEPQNGPGTYKEALTNFKIAIFRETFPEDRITKDDRDSILEILGKALHRTPLTELPPLKSYILAGGALIYTCVNQQSGQWLIKTIDSHGLGSGGRLKATEAKNLPSLLR